MSEKAVLIVQAKVAFRKDSTDQGMAIARGIY